MQVVILEEVVPWVKQEPIGMAVSLETDIPILHAPCVMYPVVMTEGIVIGGGIEVCDPPVMR